MISLTTFLRPWLLPPGVNILLALIGFGLYFYRRPLGKIFIFLSFISLWLCSAPIFSYNLIEILQNKYPSLTLDSLNQLSRQGAIVILGGGHLISIELGNKPSLSDTSFNRVRYAAFLHQQTKLPLIVSGGKEPGASYSEAEIMSHTLKESFHITTVIQEDQSHNTADEGKFLAPLLKRQGFKIVYLVTNAWHMPRSVYIFQKEGIRVIPAPMGYQVYDHHYTLLSVLPDMHALAATSIAIHELIGLLWYHLRY